MALVICCIDTVRPLRAYLWMQQVWKAYDAFQFGIEIPKDAPKSQQERAYTSPIWHKPKG